MNLSEIETKCFILALFVRDDGLRFLLGTGAYEFKDSQLHFAGNTIENDVVSVQGNDGYLLAGQVRRPSTQVFDGYIGDASVNKSEIEGYRRDFFAFFRKNHFYTVVYVMPDGTAIQRRRGFLVDAPTVKELWQLFPEYHIGLNFEDINYYDYSENSEGEETYGKSADIGLAKAIYGGLIWDESSSTQVYNSGTDFSISGTEDGKQVDYIDLYGDTEQTTYSGKNLLGGLVSTGTNNGLLTVVNADGSLSVSGTATSTYATLTTAVSINIANGTAMTFSIKSEPSVTVGVILYNTGYANRQDMNIGTSSRSVTVTTNSAKTLAVVWCTGLTVNTAYDFKIEELMLEANGSATTYEPYVGGMASPNPDYPQEVKTVTGRQVITVSDGDSQSQEYEINLGKNLYNLSAVETDTPSSCTVALTDGVVDGTWSGGFNAYLKTPNGRDLSLDNRKTYTVSLKAKGDAIRVRLTNDIEITVGANADYTTYTKTVSGLSSIRIWVNRPAGVASGAYSITDVQIEEGSTATTYAPYFTPIELCKIGDYQDYIYSVNGDYYLHKEVAGYTVTGSEPVSVYNSNVADLTNLFNSSPFVVQGGGVCNRASYNPVQTSVSTTITLGEFALQKSGNTYNFFLKLPGSSYTQSTVQQWFIDNVTTIYYPLVIPTDTQITNATLISELEALNAAECYENVTWFKSESSDLPAIMQVYVQANVGGGVVWDANGAEWEDGGGGESTIVTVDSIDTVLPVWTVTGKATNPTLTNLTTGMSISYTGTIAQGQTLVVDLLNKTAKLNGTSVISGLTGQWVEFIPGNNRVSYSTDNSDAPDSKIEWQEVVG